jgi:hypothetical protein
LFFYIRVIIRNLIIRRGLGSRVSILHRYICVPSQARTWISNAICCGLFCMFECLEWKVVVRFGDKGGIVGHHWLFWLLFIIKCQLVSVLPWSWFWPQQIIWKSSQEEEAQWNPWWYVGNGTFFSSSNRGWNCTYTRTNYCVLILNVPLIFYISLLVKKGLPDWVQSLIRFSPGTPASSTTKTGRHDIAEILLLKVALSTKNQSSALFVCIIHLN